MVDVEVVVIRNGKTETFQHTIPDTSKTSLEVAVDYFDGQVGTTLAVYEKVTNECLYKAIVDVSRIVSFDWDLIDPYSV
jgi:hypothetical protein